MRIFVAGLVTLTLIGCVERQPKAAAPPPTPAAKTEPPADTEPFSIVQNQAKLPSPQPLTQEALASIVPPPPPAPAPVERTDTGATARSSRRGAASGGAKGDTTAAVTGPAEPPPAPAAEERPRIQAIVSPGERRQMNAELESRRKQINDLLARIDVRKLTAEQKNTVNRTRSFLALFERAWKRGDFRQADSLSDRALVMARGLDRAQQQ